LTTHYLESSETLEYRISVCRSRDFTRIRFLNLAFTRSVSLATVS